MTSATLPQAIIPIGYVMVQGVRAPVTVDIEWMRLFNDLLNRTGGTSGDEGFSNYINLLSDIPNSTPATKENSQNIENLMLEIESLKSNNNALNQRLDELYNRVENQPKDDFRNRIEVIEGRLA